MGRYQWHRGSWGYKRASRKYLARRGTLGVPGTIKRQASSKYGTVVVDDLQKHHNSQFYFTNVISLEYTCSGL